MIPQKFNKPRAVALLMDTRFISTASGNLRGVIFREEVEQYPIAGGTLPLPRINSVQISNQYRAELIVSM
jgi:hypothetical protein